METGQELLDLEREGWDALSAGPEAAVAFYDRVLAAEVLMLFPGAVVIDSRASVIDSMRGEPWTSYRLSEERVLPLGEDAAVVAYRARAVRGDDAYEALVSSTYRREGGAWKLAVHQQTPVS